MEDATVSSSDELDARRPGWVTVAAVLSIVSAALTSAQALSAHGLSFAGLLGIGLCLGFIAVAIGLFQLKKWAYWAFLGLTALGAINIASDLLLIALGEMRNAKIQPGAIVQLGIAIAWLIYFNTKDVRVAFRVS